MAASDKYLGLLHSEVAEVMRAMIKPVETSETVMDADGEEILHVRLVYPSPAILAVAVKFLKDNSISADIENDDALKDIKEALAAKRKGGISQQDLRDAAAVTGLMQ